MDMGHLSWRDKNTPDGGGAPCLPLRAMVFEMAAPSDPPHARMSAPSVQRNREPIFGVLSRVLPATGLVLEVASGTGEHAVFFAARLPALTWQPSDVDPRNRANIAALA